MREFSIGFGPKLLGLRINLVLFGKFVFPFGGFVKFEGDFDPSSLSSKNNYSKDTNHFNNASVISRV